MTVRVTREAEPQIELYGAFSGQLAGNGKKELTFTPTENYLIMVVKNSLSNVQLEQGAFKTSYIPTTTAAKTRSADIASIDVDQFGYNKKAGTVVATFQAVDTTSEQQYVLGSNTGSARWCYSNSGDTNLHTYDGSTSATASGFTADTEHTAAFGSTLSEQFIVLNGGTVNSASTNGNIPSLTTELAIGRYSTIGYLNGHIKSIKYYPRRLSNTQLQEVTS